MAPICFLVGAALIVAGVALLSIPAALITAGVGAIAVSVELMRPVRRPKIGDGE